MTCWGWTFVPLDTSSFGYSEIDPMREIGVISDLDESWCDIDSNSWDTVFMVSR